MLTDLKNHLLELELQLLDPKVRASAEALETLLSEDFLEFGGSGIRFGKEEAIAGLLQEPPVVFEHSDIVYKELSPSIMHLTYRAIEKRKTKPELSYSLRCSIWKNSLGIWRIVFHQATACDAFKPKTKSKN